MTARSLHAVVTGKVRKAHVTGQPVRRNSKRAGECEHRIWRPFDRREFNARMRAAEKFDRDGKQPGKRNGPLGAIALDLYRELMRMVDWKTGRLDPAIETLCRKLRRSRDAICAAKERLKEHGFLDWIRRTEPVENPDPFGPQVRQITNAYELKLPKTAAEFVRRLMRRPTEAQRNAAQARDAQARVDAALDEHAQAEQVAQALSDGDSPLGRQLRSLGAAFDRLNASPPSGENPALTGTKGM